MRSMLSNNGQPDDRSELIIQNNMSQLLLATGWNLDDDGHHDTAMQNRWSALNGPINWRKQTKKTKHNPQKFSHQCTSKPVASKNDMKMRVSRSMKKLDRTPSLWATGTCAYMGNSNSPNTWNRVPTRTLRQMFENLPAAKCPTRWLELVVFSNKSMVHCLCIVRQTQWWWPTTVDVAASARRPMIHTLLAGQPACVWLLKTNHLCRRSVPLFLWISDSSKDTQKLLPSVRDTRTLPCVGSFED